MLFCIGELKTRIILFYEIPDIVTDWNQLRLNFVKLKNIPSILIRIVRDFSLLNLFLFCFLIFTSIIHMYIWITINETVSSFKLLARTRTLMALSLKKYEYLGVFQWYNVLDFSTGRPQDYHFVDAIPGGMSGS